MIEDELKIQRTKADAEKQLADAASRFVDLLEKVWEKCEKLIDEERRRA